MPIKRWDNVITGPVGERMAKFLENYPKADEIYITSARDGDHGGQSHHYGLSYSGSPTAALDIGAGGVGAGSERMRDFAKWLYDNYADLTVELIHSTPFPDDRGFYVKNQVRNPGGSVYGGPQTIGHFDHVHWATSAALMTQLEQRDGQPTPAVLVANLAAASTPGPIANTSPVWGWDASDYDWDRGPMNLVEARRDGISFFVHKTTEGQDWAAKHYREALERARGAEIPVLGAYHFLWPDNVEAQVDWWMSYVDRQTPWWKDVPWIWQIDAEKSNPMPRPPSAAEVQKAVNLVRQRMADQGAKGYVVAYAPRWLYGNTLPGDFDIWNSDYNGSGAARAFKEQYQGVTDVGPGWKPMSGRKPTILQFASDGVVGNQPTCDVNKFDGDLFALLEKCGRVPAQVPGGLDTPAIEAFNVGFGIPVAAPAAGVNGDLRDLIAHGAEATPTSLGADGGLIRAALERLAFTYNDPEATALLNAASAVSGSPVPASAGHVNGN